MAHLWLVCSLLLQTLVQNCYSASDLKKACDQYAATGAQAIYEWNSCITYPADRYDWTTSKSKCDHFANGHLLVLPLVEMLDIIQKFTALENTWLGAAQANGSSEPYGGWEWHLAGGRVVPLLMQNQPGVGIWGTAQPNQYGGNPEDCLSYRLDAGVLNDQKCDNHVEKRFCQYDDPKARRIYTKDFPQAKGNEAGKLAEYTDITMVDCANKCSADPLCHSFSFSQNGAHCVLNLDDGTYPGFEAQSDLNYDMFVWKLG